MLLAHGPLNEVVFSVVCFFTAEPCSFLVCCISAGIHLPQKRCRHPGCWELRECSRRPFPPARAVREASGSRCFLDGHMPPLAISLPHVFPYSCTVVRSFRRFAVIEAPAFNIQHLPTLSQELQQRFEDLRSTERYRVVGNVLTSLYASGNRSGQPTTANCGIHSTRWYVVDLLFAR